ncbi:hypothetical protein TNCV_1309631 [Trichonephila clavipes]|nr:hypothetical protein TNCV_1309631 [Trichonephila clavipes]
MVICRGFLQVWSAMGQMRDIDQALSPLIAAGGVAIYGVEVQPVSGSVVTFIPSLLERDSNNNIISETQWLNGSVSRFHATGSGFKSRAGKGPLIL